jgi:hypothetical protein
MSEENPYRIPSSCPICGWLIRGSRTIQIYYDYGCCPTCFIYFVEGREERWKSGWRPSPEQIQARKDALA